MRWKFTVPAANATLPFTLQGHVALVTGGNHGIGAATARASADCGADVLVSYLRIADPPDPASLIVEAREALHTLSALAPERYVPPYSFALVHAGLGNVTPRSTG